ncbi:MAG: hypothetical protein RMI79_03755 [Nitrososphaerota archaeon]|nr:hypothetical protein [Leptospiraceae bacterium]MDW8034036.1 hypothetical protein [Nitrososphaerota archaeon]
MQIRQKQKKKIKEELGLLYFSEEEARELLSKFVKIRESTKAYVFWVLGLLGSHVPHLWKPQRRTHQRRLVRYLAKELSYATESWTEKYYNPNLFMTRWEVLHDYARLLAASGAPNLNEYAIKKLYGIDEKKARKVLSNL